MLLQKGGYKLKKSLRDAIQERPDVFMEYIRPMILDETSTFNVVSDESVYSFVIRMTLPQEYNSSFVDDNEVPVYTFVFKICIIKNPESAPNTTLKKKGAISKGLTSEAEFYQEALVQQKIWSESMTLGYPDICAKLTDATVIKDTHFTQQIIYKIFSGRPDIQTYLQSDIIDKGRWLGFITMESLDGNVFSKIPQNESAGSVALICAVVLRLFFIHGVIHCDFHNNNSLFGRGRVSALDFGRTVTADQIVEKINTDGKLLDDFREKAKTELNEGRSLPLDVTNEADKLFERFEKLHAFNYCFNKGQVEIKIERKNDILTALWFITNLELFWMENIYLAENHSNIRVYLSQLSKDNSSLVEILHYYNILTETKVPQTPIKETLQVKSFAPLEILYPSLLIFNEETYDECFDDFLTIHDPNDVATYHSNVRLSDAGVYARGKEKGTPYSDDSSTSINYDVYVARANEAVKRKLTPMFIVNGRKDTSTLVDPDEEEEFPAIEVFVNPAAASLAINDDSTHHTKKMKQQLDGVLLDLNLGDVPEDTTQGNSVLNPNSDEIDSPPGIGTRYGGRRRRKGSRRTRKRCKKQKKTRRLKKKSWKK